MSNFPLPAGCRKVCRPNRATPRRFTPGALKRIIRTMLADDPLQDTEMCIAIIEGGLDCCCEFVIPRVLQILDDELGNTDTALWRRIRDFIAELHDNITQLQRWVDLLDLIPDRIKSVVVNFVETKPVYIPTPLWDMVAPALKTLVKGVNLAGYITYMAELIAEAELALQEDPAEEALRKVRDLVATLCVDVKASE